MTPPLFRWNSQRVQINRIYYNTFRLIVHPTRFLFFHILLQVKIWLVSLLHFWAAQDTIIDEEKEGMVPDMSEEFGPDFITVTDEDGNEFELEHLDTLEYNGQTYMAFFPAVQGEEGDKVQDVDLDDEEYGLIILKAITVDGEEQLSTLDSEEELELVYQQFMEALFADEEDN